MTGPAVKPVTIIGAGLAGCEAAWQASIRGVPVRLFEMKPTRYSPAHRSPGLAELVCSNSFRSESLDSAVGILKREMTMMNSLIMEAAAACRVPAGRALAVDRKLFSAYIEDRLCSRDNCRVERVEVADIPDDIPLVIASGPLTSNKLADAIAELTGSTGLFFYDAISPVIETESIDFGRVFRASRYQEGEGDYINCPLDRDEYENLHREIMAGREIQLNDFEDRRCFEGCLPIEVLARRGIDTLRYGPMKPVGLTDPRTGKQPWAVVQLRRENLQGSLYNMVGFQTKLAYPEQKRIFRMIPGLESAEFARYGSIHRNTFIDSPRLLTEHLELRSRPGVFFAGQITGVEGYLESAASGLFAGINAALLAGGSSCPPPPPETAIGALVAHVTNRDALPFQPMNVNFGLFPRPEKRIGKKERGAFRAYRSAEHLVRWKATVDGQVFLS